jgi:hypothetical protein
VNRRRRLIRGGFGGASPIPLPSTSGTVLSAFAPNLVVEGYTGALFQLVRASDSATMDVMPTASGWPNYSAIDGWAAGSALTVSEVCDQKSSGIGAATNLVQTTPALRPVFTSLNALSGRRSFGCHTLADLTGLANIPRFDIPAALSLSRQNFGIHAVINPRGCAQNRAYISMDNGAASDYIVMYNNASFGINPGLVTTKAKSQLQCLSYTGSGANYKLYKDGAVLTGSASTAQTMNGGGNIGGSNQDAAFTSQADYYAMTFFSTTPSDADITALNTWAGEVYPLAGLSPTKRLVYSGSSLITSYYSTLGQTALFQMNFDYNTWDAFANGVGGQTLATQYTNRGTTVNPLYSASRTKNVLVIDAPSNDIQAGVYADQAAAEAAADSIYNTVTLPFVAAWKALGASCAVVVPTIIARGPFDTSTNYRQYALLRYNSNVTAGAVANGYTAADRYGDSRLQNAFDGTYYNLGDNVHLVNAGYAVMAEIDKAAILAA